MDWFLLLAVVLLGIHAPILAYFIATEGWAKEVARTNPLPDWMVGWATRNRTRVSRFIIGSMATIAAAACLVATADDQAGAWRLGVAGFALGFNLVSFVVERAGIRAQRRLVTEMKARIDQTRLERSGLEPASV